MNVIVLFLVFQRMLFIHIHNKVLIVEEKMSSFHHEEFFLVVLEWIIVVWKMNRFFMYIIVQEVFFYNFPKNFWGVLDEIWYEVRDA